MANPGTVADRVKVMTDAHNAEFTRSPQPDGTVFVTLHLPAGDRISGTGSTTADAVTALEKRIAAFTKALGA